MNSINTQKLISAFLILSTAVSSSVLIFATSGDSKIAEVENFAVANKLPSNAFADESIKQIAGFSTYNTLAAKSGKTQDNLTDYFAEKLLGQLAEDNDSGTVNITESGVSFVIPDMESGLGYFLKDPQVSLIASVNPGDIKTKKGNTAEDIQKYFEEMVPIVEVASKDLNDRLDFYSQTVVTGASFSSLDFILSNAIAKLHNMKVPTEVAEYHSAIIKTFKTRSGLTGLNNDPLRSYFYAQNFDSMMTIESKILLDATNNLNKKLSVLFPKEGSSLFAKYIGVSTAMAWVDVGALVQRVIGFITQNAQLFKTIWKYALELAINVLKDVLIKKLVQQTINWANNGFNGKPQYVENFGKVIDDTLESAGNQVLSDALKGMTGDGACPRLRPALEIAFEGNTSISPGLTDSSYSCTIDELGANLDDFANSFSDGGWVAYRNVITKPQGNFMSAYIDISDKMSAEQQKKTEEKKQDIQAGNGFLSMQKCKTPVTITAAEGAGQYETVEDAKKNLGDKFISATCATRCQTVTWCPKGDWETTTPAAVASKATTDALSQSPIASLVNIEDLGALASALVNAAITKLVGLAREGVAGLTNKVLTSKDGSTADLCSGDIDGRPRTEAEKQQCIEDAEEEIGGATKEVDGLNAQNVADGLNRLISSYSQMAALYNEIEMKGNQAKYYLDLASSTCSTAFSTAADNDVLDASYYVLQNYDFVTGKIQEAQDKIPEIIGAEGSGGIINALQELSNAVADKNIEKLKELNESLNLGITFKSTATDDENIKNFVSNLSNQIDSSSSAFSKKFLAPTEAPMVIGDLRTASDKLADGVCSILYVAKGINPDPNSCRLSPAEAECKKTNF